MKSEGLVQGQPWTCRKQRVVCAQVLDIDGALVARAGVMHRHVRCGGNGAAMAALCHSQAVDGEARGLCDFLKDLRGRGVGADTDGLGQVLDRAA